MSKLNWATALPGNAVLITIALLMTGAVQAQDTEDWPDWLKDAMAQESKKLKSKQLVIEDGLYSFTVAGKPSQPEAFDGGWYVGSDVKSNAILECYVFTGDTDLATLVTNLSEIGIETTAEANGGNVSHRTLYELDAGHLEGAPYIAVEWVFTVGEAPNAKAAASKVRAASNGAITQACAHNTLGYRETFKQAFEDFVLSTKQPAPAVQPYYEEFSVQKLNGEAIGTAKASYSLDEDGDTLIQSTTAALYPAGPGAITSSDSTSVSWSTPDGNLINATSASNENGELVVNMTLRRNDDGDWLASGSFQGKEVSQIIDGNILPLSELGQMQVARDLFAGENTTAEFLAWVADADPTQILQGTITRDDADAAGKGLLTLGPLSLNARFDELGALLEANMQIGAADLVIERAWHRGAPR